jgi:hypothetical protein
MTVSLYSKCVIKYKVLGNSIFHCYQTVITNVLGNVREYVSYTNAARRLQPAVLTCASIKATAATMPKQLSSVTFHNGQKMPIVGLGTWQVSVM